MRESVGVVGVLWVGCCSCIVVKICLGGGRVNR